MRLACALLFALALGASCGDDDSSLAAECEEIVEACHDVDDGTNLVIHECHEEAEMSWTAADCTSNRDRCLAACAAAAADGGP